VLEQNIPNPFSPSTRIRFTLKEHTKVLLEIHDINGVKNQTLADDWLSEGSYDFLWEPGNLPAGMYYLVLKTGKFIQVKKVVYTGGN
jgi:pectate lyase